MAKSIFFSHCYKSFHIPSIIFCKMEQNIITRKYSALTYKKSLLNGLRFIKKKGTSEEEIPTSLFWHEDTSFVQPIILNSFSLLKITRINDFQTFTYCMNAIRTNNHKVSRKIKGKLSKLTKQIDTPTPINIAVLRLMEDT